MLPAGKAADTFGEKKQLLCGLLWISVSAFVAALMPTPISFLILCGAIGFGTAIGRVQPTLCTDLADLRTNSLTTSYLSSLFHLPARKTTNPCAWSGWDGQPCRFHHWFHQRWTTDKLERLASFLRLHCRTLPNPLRPCFLGYTCS